MHAKGATALCTFPGIFRLLMELESRSRHLWIQSEILDIFVWISILWDTRGRRYSYAHVSSIISAPELESRDRHLWIQDEVLDFLVQILILWETRRRRYCFPHVSSIISANNWVRDSESTYLDSGRNFGFVGLDFDFVRCTGTALQLRARFLDYLGC